MFELKQDDWIAVCKEVDALKAELSGVKYLHERLLAENAKLRDEVESYLYNLERQPGCSACDNNEANAVELRKVIV